MPPSRSVISSEREKSFPSPFPMTPSLSLLGEAPSPPFRDTVFPVPCCQTLSVLPPTKKDPSAALGMTKRGKTSSHFFSFRCEPTSAPSGRLLPEEGGRMPASPIANPFPASSTRNLSLFCGTI